MHSSLSGRDKSSLCAGGQALFAETAKPGEPISSGCLLRAENSGDPMEPGQALAVGIVIILIVFVAAAYIWYYKMGWKAFSFKGVVPYAAGPACTADALPSGACPPNKTCCPNGQTCVGGFCQSGRAPSWTAEGDADVTALRFLDCIFTVTDPQGVNHMADVTTVLNGMAVAHRGSITKTPRTLYLDRPLNAFSFVISGVNDSATVTTAAEAATWKNCATTLTGQWRTI